MRVLTQLYGDLLEEYFVAIKKKKNSKKINKEEFYAFIKENIAPNYNNEKILAEISSNHKDSIFYLEANDEKNNANNSSDNKNEIIIEKQQIKNVFIHKRAKSFNNGINIFKEILPEKTNKHRKKSYDNKINNNKKNL